MDLFFGGITFDSRRVMSERNPPRFQSDEHAFGGYHGAFLWAKVATTYEDEHLSLSCDHAGEILRWGSCRIL